MPKEAIWIARVFSFYSIVVHFTRAIRIAQSEHLKRLCSLRNNWKNAHSFACLRGLRLHLGEGEGVGLWRGARARNGGGPVLRPADGEVAVFGLLQAVATPPRGPANQEVRYEGTLNYVKDMKWGKGQGGERKRT